MNQGLLEHFYYLLSGYNQETYWKYAKHLYDSTKSKLFRTYCLYRIKKAECKNGASLGFRLDGGPRFLAKPILPHGIKGIFITPDTVVGRNVIIYQYVVLGMKNIDDTRGPIIGDNVLIGAGAKILGG